jgi:hypothetical protein
VKLRTLPAQFDRANFRHTLVIRRGSVAVYRRKHLRFDHGDFEVVVIRASKPHPKDPNYEGYDRVEIYPSDSAWGILGFTYPAEKEAIRKMAAILTSGDAPPLMGVKACGAFVELGG